MKPEKPEKVVTVKQPVQEPVPESNLTDDAISKASREAKKKLPELRKAFNAGLQPGEFILVKAPFKAPDGGQEWMWVEVTSWNGSQIKGLLQNEPVYIPDLHSGQIVNVNEEDVFDYMRQDAKGNIEGNETGKLMVEEQPSE